MTTLSCARMFALCVSASMLGGVLMGCGPTNPKETEAPTKTDAVVAKSPKIGGQDVVTLSRGRSGTGSTPEFLSATLLPGRGMNMFQITAWIPEP